MPDPLEEIEFLARSGNRIELLDTLAERAYSRRELGEAVAASQPTIGRVLNDLSDRGWVTYDGERYAATPTGRLVAAGITDLRERLAAESRLREIAGLLPAVDVDLRAFGDATITTPSSTRPGAPIQRMLELLGATDRVWLLSHSFNRQKLELLHERTVDGTLTTEGVFAADAVEAVASDPALRGKLRAVLRADAAEIRTVEGDVPVALEVTDDRTHLLLRDGEGVVRASMDTDDPTVRDWATGLHAEYWERASPVEPGELE